MISTSVSANPRRNLVRRLTDLHAEVQRAGQVALDKAHQAGLLLRDLPRVERAQVLLEAGISERTG